MNKLKEHIENGNIYIDNDDYIGIAIDGVHVIIGQVGYEDDIESYLLLYPTPDTW